MQCRQGAHCLHLLFRNLKIACAESGIQHQRTLGSTAVQCLEGKGAVQGLQPRSSTITLSDSAGPWVESALPPADSLLVWSRAIF